MALCVPVLGVAAGAVPTVLSGVRAAEVDERVDRSLEVRSDLRRLHGRVAEAEAAVLGYLLTGGPEWLGPYHAVRADAQAMLGRVRSGATDARVRTQLTRAEGDLDAALDALGEMVAHRPAGAAPVPVPGPTASGSRRLIEDARAALVSVDEGEARALERQTARDRRNRVRHLALAGLGVAGGLAAAVAATLAFAGGVARRVRQLDEDARRMHQGLPVLSVRRGNDEVDQLGRTLERAAERVSEREAAVRQDAERLSAVTAMLLDLATATQEADAGRAAAIVRERVPQLVAADAALLELTEDGDGLQLLRLRPSDVLRCDDSEADPRVDLTACRRLGARSLIVAPVRAGGTVTGALTVTSTRAGAFRDRDASTLGVVGRLLGASLALADELAARRRPAEERRPDRSPSELLARVSHELRTPLNAVLGFSQLLELEDLTSDQHDAVAHIGRAGRDLVSLLDEVLDVARVESGAAALAMEPVPPQEVVAEVLELVRPAATRQGVHVPDRVTVGGDDVWADRSRLRQVLVAAASEVLADVRADGRIDVTVVPDGDHRLRFHVRRSDAPVDHRASAPASSSDPSRASVRLTLAGRLAEAMGGRLGVEGEEGHVHGVWVDLALAESPDGASVAANGATRRSGRSPRLLYVEDNPSNVDLVETILGHRPEITLVTAMHGRTALELARRERPDLVLLDLNLPDVAGDEVLRRLRRDPSTSTVPVVVVSGDATPDQHDRLVALGATDCLAKPFDVAGFLAMVDRLVSA